ncbi:AAA family ATPase, partial [bacterium LRH843]|nr:AAA family ATPase [bacterium LRH843]
ADINALSSKERSEINANIRHMDKKLERLGMHLGDLEEDARDKVQVLNRDIAKQVLLPKVEQLLTKFAEVEGLKDYLKYYAEDIINNVEVVLEQEEDDFTPGLFSRIPSRYQANVIVSHKSNAGAPVIFEDFPTHYNLLG